MYKFEEKNIFHKKKKRFCFFFQEKIKSKKNIYIYINIIYKNIFFTHSHMENKSPEKQMN